MQLDSQTTKDHRWQYPSLRCSQCEMCDWKLLENVKLNDALFVFPPWLILTVILFAVLVTTAAAVYPARRAARVDPVTALRHE